LNSSNFYNAIVNGINLINISLNSYDVCKAILRVINFN